MQIATPVFFGFVALALGYLLRCIPSPPVFDFPPVTIPRITKLNHTKPVKALNEILGAESFAEDPETGDIYTGAANGTLYRLRIARTFSNEITVSAVSVLEDHAPSVRRILGLKYVKAPEPGSGPSLIACDAALGLIKVENILSPGHASVKVLANQVMDDDVPVPIVFCNSLVLSPDETKVYFTTSADRSLPQLPQEVLGGYPSGRLLSHDLRTNETKILRRRLAFANGLEMSHDQSALLVVELMRSKILRYDLSSGVWASWAVLPFLPDNIQRSKDFGKYLVGGAVWRSRLVESLLSRSVLARKVLLAAPDLFLRTFSRVLGKRGGYVCVLDEDGKVEQLYDGSSVGAAATSEGFVTSGNILLWGSYDYSTPVLAMVP